MSKLIRHFSRGQSVFITSVTAHRERILVEHADLLAPAVRRAKCKMDFRIIAWVVLPDHFHAILDVPNGETSRIMKRIKRSFSGQYNTRTGNIGAVWQHRYWDHIIRSQEDMNRHLDYIHYNPVKHRLVESPREYRLSSFRKFYRIGQCEWGWRVNESSFTGNEYGE